MRESEEASDDSATYIISLLIPPSFALKIHESSVSGGSDLCRSSEKIASRIGVCQATSRCSHRTKVGGSNIQHMSNLNRRKLVHRILLINSTSHHWHKWLNIYHNPAHLAMLAHLRDIQSDSLSFSSERSRWPFKASRTPRPFRYTIAPIRQEGESCFHHHPIRHCANWCRC